MRLVEVVPPAAAAVFRHCHGKTRLSQLGTYPLPESQPDRFLMRTSLGYPDRAAERLLLSGADRRDQVSQLQPVLQGDELAQLQRAVLVVHTSDALLDYVQNLISATRSGRWFAQGPSPRVGIALVRAAKARALLEGRTYVAPDDVQAVLAPCIAHRLVPVVMPGAAPSNKCRPCSKPRPAVKRAAPHLPLACASACSAGWRACPPPTIWS